MGQLYREWVDADVEDLTISKRNLSTPSGLPSPTETGVLRLSPDNFVPSPDFSAVAPPVPPVFIAPDMAYQEVILGGFYHACQLRLHAGDLRSRDHGTQNACFAEGDGQHVSALKV